MFRSLSSLLLLSLVLLLASCADTAYQEAIQQRNLAISSEPQGGDYYIGRRFVIDHTQFWGYVRRPGHPWADAKLVIFNESKVHQPDRLHEMPVDSSPGHGYDHNYEYHIWGSFSGRKVYDPNSDLFLPEFMLTKWELTNTSPGWLFSPKDKFDGTHLLRWSIDDQAMQGHRG